MYFIDNQHMKYFSFPQTTQSMQSINPLINISQNPIQHQSFHDLLVAPIPHSSVQTIDTGLIQEEEKINQILYKSNPKFFNSSMSFVDYAIEIDPIQLRPNPLFNQFQTNNNSSNNNIQNLNKSLEEGLKVNIRNASYSSINIFNNSFDNKINNIGEDFSLLNQPSIIEDIKKEILPEGNMNILNNNNNNNNQIINNNNHSLLPKVSGDTGNISNFEFKKTEQRKNLLGIYNQLKKEQNKS